MNDVISDNMNEEVLVLIPARLASTRLENKPLADIAGKPMIVHVWEKAMQAGIGRVVVAAAEQAICDAVTAAGGEAVLTDPDLPSGSDRIHEALETIDPQARYRIIVNLQGDLPTLDPQLVRRVSRLIDRQTDMATLVAQISDAAEDVNPNVVKAVVAWDNDTKTSDMKIGKALYFTRATAPHGDGPRYHHIGIYAYRREALQRFVSLPPSPLEQREKLEQLRALEAGMVIAVSCVDTIPLGVDTPEDLQTARTLLADSDGNGG